jgi:hypothetical protein
VRAHLTNANLFVNVPEFDLTLGRVVFARMSKRADGEHGAFLNPRYRRDVVGGGLVQREQQRDLFGLGVPDVEVFVERNRKLVRV